jgi:hypothetical protein
MARIWSSHDAVGSFTPTVGVKPQSINGATVNGTAIDLQGKAGAYFAVNVGNVTGSGDWLAFLQDSADNSTFANVNTTTYPDATTGAADTTANVTDEMAYMATSGRARYVRPVVTTATNAVLISVTSVTMA